MQYFYSNSRNFIIWLFEFDIFASENETAPSVLVKVAAQAGAQAGATLGSNSASKSGAKAGAEAGAQAGAKAGAEAGAIAATEAATEVATKTLKEALAKLGAYNKPVECQCNAFWLTELRNLSIHFQCF